MEVISDKFERVGEVIDNRGWEFYGKQRNTLIGKVGVAIVCRLFQDNDINFKRTDYKMEPGRKYCPLDIVTDKYGIEVKVCMMKSQPRIIIDAKARTTKRERCRELGLKALTVVVRPEGYKTIMLLAKPGFRSYRLGKMNSISRFFKIKIENYR